MHSQINELIEVMQCYFPWHKARLKFASTFILSVIKLRSVNFPQLANALNGKAKKESNYRRIQRFFAQFDLSCELVAQLILCLLPVKSDFIISIDRTNWKLGKFDINIFTAGIVYKGMAFPICWMLLQKRGNSDTIERITLMKQLLTRIKKSQISMVVADREFIGQEWFAWLKTQKIAFAIRIKENATIKTGKKDIALRQLFANLQIHQETTLRKPRLIYGHRLYLSAIRLVNEFLIVASQEKGRRPLLTYKKRWGIEVLFANLKSRGFDLEQTHLIHEDRIQKLIALLAIALSWAHLLGEWMNLHSPLKTKNHGRKEKSLFRYGLDHLQYVLLNLQDRFLDFLHCLRFLKQPAIFPNS